MSQQVFQWAVVIGIGFIAMALSAIFNVLKDVEYWLRRMEERGALELDRINPYKDD